MKKAFKWIGISLGALLGLLLVAGFILYIKGSKRLNKTYDIAVEKIRVPQNDSTILRGKHLVETRAFCQGCHGDDLGGLVLFDEPPIATVFSPNLTSGKGGLGNTLTDTDFIRAIRHGVSTQGKSLMIMHADFYHNLSREDLGSIITYLKTIPPVDRVIPERKIRPLGKIMVALGVFDSESIPFLPAELIDHDAPFVESPEPGPTLEYGTYLVSTTFCTMCHGKDLKGGPPIEPGMPPPPGILTYGPNGFTEEQFFAVIRNGVNPAGKELNPDAMPWKMYSNLTDQEIKSIYKYISSFSK